MPKRYAIGSLSIGSKSTFCPAWLRQGLQVGGGRSDGGEIIEADNCAAFSRGRYVRQRTVGPANQLIHVHLGGGQIGHGAVTRPEAEGLRVGGVLRGGRKLALEALDKQSGTNRVRVWSENRQLRVTRFPDDVRTSCLLPKNMRDVHERLELLAGCTMTGFVAISVRPECQAGKRFVVPNRAGLELLAQRVQTKCRIDAARRIRQRIGL